MCLEWSVSPPVGPESGPKVWSVERRCIADDRGMEQWCESCDVLWAGWKGSGLVHKKHGSSHERMCCMDLVTC